MIKVLLLSTSLMITACSGKDIFSHLIEQESGLSVKYGASACAQLKMNCPKGAYSEGPTSDGGISCSCQRKTSDDY